MTKYDIDVICTFLSLFSILFSIISLILSGITTKRILSFKNDLNVSVELIEDKDNKNKTK
ncbi:MAG: hypothetical protein SPJ27_06030 [Candidatus Onthovivens sp.]|nr:hypothetical protein [Candidatus Onthovivens sp.]